MTASIRSAAVAVSMLLGVMSVAACASVGDSSSVTSEGSLASIDACDLIDTEQAMVALGTNTATDVGGPTVIDTGAHSTTCNWRNTNPNCFMRSLSAQVRTDDRSVAEFAALDESAYEHVTIDGLGDGAFSSAEELPAGSAIEVHHLDVLVDETWIRFTLSGRIPSESSRRVLREIAATAIA